MRLTFDETAERFHAEFRAWLEQNRPSEEEMLAEPALWSGIVAPEYPDLNEVFLTDVIVSQRNLVGTLNNGWAMANGSLAHERGMVWVSSSIVLEDDMGRLINDAPVWLERLPQPERHPLAERITDAYIDTVAARCLGYRGFAKLLRGGSAPEHALMKAFTSEARRNLAMVASDVQGPEVLNASPPAVHATTLVPEVNSSWLEQYFRTFALTISAGSSEIQRNIIAERVLGLPRN